jgi:hypothetical protein
MKEKQLRLFDMPKKLYGKAKVPLWYVEIIESDGGKYVIWLRKNVHNIPQAKKVAAKLYNRDKGFIEESFVKFGKVLEK